MNQYIDTCYSVNMKDQLNDHYQSFQLVQPEYGHKGYYETQIDNSFPDTFPEVPTQILPEAPIDAFPEVPTKFLAETNYAHNQHQVYSNGQIYFQVFFAI